MILAVNVLTYKKRQHNVFIPMWLPLLEEVRLGVHRLDNGRVVRFRALSLGLFLYVHVELVHGLSVSTVDRRLYLARADTVPPRDDLFANSSQRVVL